MNELTEIHYECHRHNYEQRRIASEETTSNDTYKIF